MPSLSVPITLGNIAGAASDGVLVGQITNANPTKVLLKGAAQPCLCITDDGGVFVNETTPANESTDDDVEIVGTTIAAGDAIYVGHATLQPKSINFNITTQGDYTTTTFTYKYWNGTAWTALSGVTDGTTAFEAATGIATLSFTAPTDWAKNTVDSVNAYWVQIECAATGGSTTPCQIGQIWVIVDESIATWVDDTTDATDADASDVAGLPAHSVVGDGLYVGYGSKFCAVKTTVGTARTGTATITPKYWNGTSWTALTTIDDDSAGFSTGTSSYFTQFVPPTDWVANTATNGPNGQTGFFITFELTAKTSVTVVPLITQMWVQPLVTGATGVPIHESGSYLSVTAYAQTVSATNASSVFLIVNTTTGAHAPFTWTAGDALVSSTLTLKHVYGDQLLIKQITEDGTTEFADATFIVEKTAS